MLRRARDEVRKLRGDGPVERVRDVLQLNGVSWRSQGELSDRVAALEAAPPPVPVPAAAAAPGDDFTAMAAWLDALPPVALKVSVVLATRDRAEVLPRAVAAVQAQTHADWELVVVDDGSTDGTAGVLAGAEDERIRVVTGPGRGAGAARNAGLAAATGDVVAYADDDNVMGPRWLAAVAWAFSSDPELEVAYGARVLEGDDGLPRTELEPFEWHRLVHANFVDMGALAHRRELPEARFDEALGSGSDWELLSRLTRERDPLRLPVVALVYRTDAPGRLSDAIDPAEHDRIRARIAGSRPLRILGFNQYFPLITETYIGEELRALTPFGVELAWARDEQPVSPMAVPEPVFADLDTGVREWRPDLIVLHWTNFAVTQLDRLERAGIPFAARVHGFDLLPQVVAKVREHPLCVGVWTYPSEAYAGLGQHALSVMLTSELPPPAAERDLVLSVSAGLPKKDLPTLVEGLAAVRGERRIVVGMTNRFGHVPGEIAELCRRHPDPPLVQVNLDREHVFALQARAAVQVYTLGAEHPFGMPMSIVEALCAGCSVVVPDRPECRAYAGPHARAYRTAADIARHCQEALAGGPAVEAEREANRRYGRERFVDAPHAERFHGELVEALARHARTAWRRESSVRAQPQARMVVPGGRR